MKTVRQLAILALLLGPILVVQEALAFGAAGHWAIGALAFDQLTPAARARVEALLSGGREALGDGCNWPDRVRSTPEFALTAPLHYVNIPPGEHYDAEAHCREGNCLIAAIPRFVSVLGDDDRAPEEQAEALKFVCHFVGDLHQPLHVGYGFDRGGNDHGVPLGPTESVDLHSLWDDVLPAFLLGKERAAERLVSACERPKGSWREASVLEWLAESRDLVERSDGVYPGEGGVDAAYLGRGVGVTRERLCLAAARLALVLNARFR